MLQKLYARSLIIWRHALWLADVTRFDHMTSLSDVTRLMIIKPLCAWLQTAVAINHNYFGGNFFRRWLLFLWASILSKRICGPPNVPLVGRPWSGWSFWKLRVAIRAPSRLIASLSRPLTRLLTCRCNVDQNYCRAEKWKALWIDESN